MKSFDTIHKEYLLQRLELSDDLSHAIGCSITERIPALEREIERLEKIIVAVFC